MSRGTRPEDEAGIALLAVMLGLVVISILAFGLVLAQNSAPKKRARI